MNRRHFLQTTSCFGLAASTALGSHAWVLRAAAAQSAIAPTHPPKRLIVIFLRGAVDSLNVVVPYQDAHYYSARPHIAIPQPGKPGGVLDLDGQFGLHPALAPLMPLWQQGSLAFVQACGSPDPTRSHFDAQDYMETGTPGTKTTPDGWMNRLMSVLANATPNPIQAIGVGTTIPRILTGPMPVATLPNGRTSKVALDRPAVAHAFDQLYGDRADALGQAYRESQASRQAINAALSQDMVQEMQSANNGAPLPIGFAQDAQKLARIMTQDARVQLGFMALGGWDTHVNQGASQGRLARNLSQLGNGLVALQTSLGPAYADTTIVVMSEFGRTVRENGNAGTDHGHGTALWLLGGNIHGGKVYGQWHGLAPDALHEGRDLAVTTDFRDVLGSLLRQHLHLSPAQLAQVFPQYKINPEGLGI